MDHLLKPCKAFPYPVIFLEIIGLFWFCSPRGSCTRQRQEYILFNVFFCFQPDPLRTHLLTPKDQKGIEHSDSPPK